MQLTNSYLLAKYPEKDSSVIPGSAAVNANDPEHNSIKSASQANFIEILETTLHYTYNKNASFIFTDSGLYADFRSYGEFLQPTHIAFIGDFPDFSVGENGKLYKRGVVELVCGAENLIGTQSSESDSEIKNLIENPEDRDIEKQRVLDSNLEEELIKKKACANPDLSQKYKFIKNHILTKFFLLCSYNYFELGLDLLEKVFPDVFIGAREVFRGNPDMLTQLKVMQESMANGLINGNGTFEVVTDPEYPYKKDLIMFIEARFMIQFRYFMH